MKKNEYIIRFSQSTLFAIIGYGALVWFTIAYTNIVLIVILSLVLASAIEPIKTRMHRFRIPSSLTVLSVFLLFFSAFVFLLFQVIPLIIQQYRIFTSALPTLTGKINTIVWDFFPNAGSFDAADILSTITIADFGTHLGNVAQVSSSWAVFAVGSVFGGIAGLFLTLFLTFYFATSTKGVNNVIRTFTPKPYKEYIIDLWSRSKLKIGLWAKGQAIIGFILGTLTYLGLILIGIENAFLFSFIIVLFSFIPVLGPILSMIPPVLFALTLPDPLTTVLLVVGLYVLIQQFEGALLYPLIVNKVVGVPSALVLIALFVGGSVAGIVGALLAAPLAAVLLEVYLDIERNTLGKISSPNAISDEEDG